MRTPAAADDPLLQLVSPPPLHAATPAEHSRFWAFAAKRGMSRDRTASTACSVLLSSALLYNISIMVRLMNFDQPELGGRSTKALVGSATASVWWVLSHALMELAFMCWVSRAPALYKRNRSGCVMVLRAGLLLLMSYYIPTTYDHTLVWEVNSGRAEAATMRIVTGFVAIHVLEVLCFRLPVRLAVPYHTARVAFCLAITPSTLRVFAKHPPITSIACRMWEQLAQLYLGTASWVLGAPLWGEPQQQQGAMHSSISTLQGTVAAGVMSPVTAGPGGQQQQLLPEGPAGPDAANGLCTVVVLLVFLNVSLGLLVPLYVLLMWEVSSFRAFLAAGEHSSSASNTSASSGSRSSLHALSSGSMTSTATGEPAGEHYSGPSEVLPAVAEGVAFGGSSSTPSFSSGGPDMAAAAGRGDRQQASVTGPPGGSSGAGGGLRGSSLLQAALAAARSGGAAASPSGHAAEGGAGGAGSRAEGAAPAPASRGGSSSGGGGGGRGVGGSSGSLGWTLSEVWPTHFTLPMHVMVLYCLTGFVWVALNTAWSAWQRRYGEGVCFMSL